MDFASNLFLSSCLTCMKASQPKMCRRSNEADLLDQISSGMPSFSELCGDRLIICIVVGKASTQNALGRLVVDSIHRTLSHNVLLYRSTTPLDVRFCGVVSSLLILFSTQNSVNQLLIYSPPLSVLIEFLKIRKHFNIILQ